MKEKTEVKQKEKICWPDIVKPLLRFDCFFAVLAMVLMFAFFFKALKVEGENEYVKLILGALIMGFQQLTTWAWRTTKAAVDKREKETGETKPPGPIPPELK